MSGSGIKMEFPAVKQSDRSRRRGTREGMTLTHSENMGRTCDYACRSSPRAKPHGQNPHDIIRKGDDGRTIRSPRRQLNGGGIIFGDKIFLGSFKQQTAIPSVKLRAMDCGGVYTVVTHKDRIGKRGGIGGMEPPQVKHL